MRQARVLQDLDLWSLPITHSNGSAVEPMYNHPRFTGPEPEPEFWGGNLYTGSCHCGAVTRALKTRGPLAQKKGGNRGM
jgi:hypothetical protein